MKIRRLTVIMVIAFIVTFISSCSHSSEVKSDAEIKEAYIINVRSGKIHSPECIYVNQMSEKNKLVSEKSLEDLLKSKYSVCRRCKAGYAKTGIRKEIDKILNPYLYEDEIVESALYSDYLQAVNEICEWYVNHIPTYQSELEEEPLKAYTGSFVNYQEYVLKDKNGEKTYRVVSDDVSAEKIAYLRDDDQILKAKEEAVLNFIECDSDIKKTNTLYYYPCELLNMSQDYCMPGDDCVRLIFAVLNRMDSQFTAKYHKLTGTYTWNNTNSKALASQDKKIIYAMMNLGFQIYDKTETVFYIDKKRTPAGYIFQIDDTFTLRKGDILAKSGHVHIYLGNGVIVKADNFGWGKVNREFPQTYDITIVKDIDGSYKIAITNNDGETSYYSRIYRYVGNMGGAQND